MDQSGELGPIVVRLRGGLGNQLFQFSAGYALSRKLGANLYLHYDHSKYEPAHSVPRLRAFNLPFKQYVINQHGLIRRKGLSGVITRLRAKALQYPTLCCARESHFHYDPQFEALPAGSYLGGYWQSYRYFAQYQDELQDLLSLSPAILENHQDLLTSIQQSISVAIHVRRGDYLHKTNTQIYSECSINYYKAAIRKMQACLGQPHFYLFSNCPEWVEQEFQWLELKTHVSTDSALADFGLMSAAQHHIIANSSFSWWAAWLATHEAQQVIAPKPWFKTKKLSDQDLLPPHWQTLPVE